MFYTPINEDLLGLPHDSNYRLYRWSSPDCRIYFSAARKGLAITIHLSSDKPGLRRLPAALSEFCEHIFNEFSWCRMIFGIIGPRSIVRLSERCGFQHFLTNDSATVMVRFR